MLKPFAKKASLFLAVLGGHFAQAQTPRGINRLSFALAPQYNLAGGNIQSDGIGPQPISTRNTVGGYIGVGYERVTRYGLVLSYEAQVLQQSHEITIAYDFRDFDPVGSVALAAARPFVANFRPQLVFFNQRLMIGYECAVGKKENGSRLQAKAGLRISGGYPLPYNGGEATGYIAYEDNNQPVIHIRPYTKWLINIDPTRNRMSGLPFSIGLGGYDFYLGIIQQTSARWLHSVSAGFEYSAGLWPDRAIGPISCEIGSYDAAGRIVSTDSYYARGRAVALRIGLNFWK